MTRASIAWPPDLKNTRVARAYRAALVLQGDQHDPLLPGLKRPLKVAEEKLRTAIDEAVSDSFETRAALLVELASSSPELLSGELGQEPVA